jgi:hypothetical protein
MAKVADFSDEEMETITIELLDWVNNVTHVFVDFLRESTVSRELFINWLEEKYREMGTNHPVPTDEDVLRDLNDLHDFIKSQVIEAEL